MAFCFNCGAQLPAGSAFCNVCGSRQASVPEQPAAQTQQAPQMNPSYQTQPVQQPYAPAAQTPPAYQVPPVQQPYTPAAPVQPQTFQQPYTPQAAPQAFSPVGAVNNAAKAGSSALKWLIPLIAAVFVIGGVFAVLYFATDIFKSDEDLIRERIEAFETAMNDGDMDGVLACLDSESRAYMETYMGVMDYFISEGSGMDVGISDLFGFAGGITMGDYCSFEVHQIYVTGDTATVTVTMTMDIYDSHHSETVTIPMIKEDGDWYMEGTGAVNNVGLTNYTSYAY